MGLLYFDRVEIGDRVGGELDPGNDFASVWPGIDDAFVHGSAIDSLAVGAIVFGHIDPVVGRNDQVGGVWIPLHARDKNRRILGVKEGETIYCADTSLKFAEGGGRGN